MNSEEVSESNQQVSVEGKTDSENNKSKEKEKEKKFRNAPPTKVAIRRLPPSMTLEKFVDQVSPLPDNDYLHFAKADSSLGQHSFCTAYVNFLHPRDVFIFKEKFDDYIFIDTKGNEFPAVVEFAPFQKIPRKKSRQRDPKCGTIDTDPDYLTFVTQVKQAQEEAGEGGVKNTCGKSSPLLSVQDVLEEIEAKERERKSRKATTPLIEFIKVRKMERQRMKDEKKEERKRREVERKRAKEEERKHRREANREAIQGKRERERKEQRREGGGIRHEDRLVSKHDGGHVLKTPSETQQSPPPGGGGGDVLKQKKEMDNNYDEAEEDEEEEVVEEEEDDPEQDMYDQEQTQKLKELLRIGTVSKGPEKIPPREFNNPDSEVANTKKGSAEKVHGATYEKNRGGGGDWERSNRSQRMGSGPYNEEYHGARPKVNRSEGGGHDRRAQGKEKKQNEQRQYGDNRHREKPTKVWLAKNEARNQKIMEERIKIQKDVDKGGHSGEFSVDKNRSQTRMEDIIDDENRPTSSASDGPTQPQESTTPTNEVEEPIGGGEERGGKESGQGEKSPGDPEGRQGVRDKGSSARGQRHDSSSSNQNTSNGEMRRMRNKVGTSRDSGSLKMIKNKDRPSIEIYRPGMRRFNLQKKEGETVNIPKSQGSPAAATSNAESTGEPNTPPPTGSGYPGNSKGKERDDKRRSGGGRGGNNKRRDGSWKQSDESVNVRPKGREDRGRGNWGGQGESVKNCVDGSVRDRYEDKLGKEDLVEVRSMTFKRSVSRD